MSGSTEAFRGENRMKSGIPVLTAIEILVACLFSGRDSLAYNAYIASAATTAAQGGTGTISVIDTTTNKVTATITAGVGIEPNGLAVAPDNSKVYIANYGDNTVSVIATTTNKVIATIPFNTSGPRGGGKVYVANAYGNTISVIATANNTVIATILVNSNHGGMPWGVAPRRGRIVVMDAQQQTIALAGTGSGGSRSGLHSPGSSYTWSHVLSEGT
jgi:YVTN family beta-propeller protein